MQQYCVDLSKSFEHTGEGYLWIKHVLLKKVLAHFGKNCDNYIRAIINEFYDNPVWIEEEALSGLTLELKTYDKNSFFERNGIHGECPISGCDFVGSLRMLYIHQYQRHGANSGIILRCPFCLCSKNIANKFGNFDTVVTKYHFLRCALTANVHDIQDTDKYAKLPQVNAFENIVASCIKEHNISFMTQLPLIQFQNCLNNKGVKLLGTIVPKPLYAKMIELSKVEFDLFPNKNPVHKDKESFERYERYTMIFTHVLMHDGIAEPYKLEEERHDHNDIIYRIYDPNKNPNLKPIPYHPKRVWPWREAPALTKRRNGFEGKSLPEPVLFENQATRPKKRRRRSASVNTRQIPEFDADEPSEPIVPKGIFKKKSKVFTRCSNRRAANSRELCFAGGTIE